MIGPDQLRSLAASVAQGHGNSLVALAGRARPVDSNEMPETLRRHASRNSRRFRSQYSSRSRILRSNPRSTG